MAATLIFSPSLISTRCATLSSPPPHRQPPGKKTVGRLPVPTSALSLAKENKASAAATCHHHYYKRGELVVVRAGGPTTTTYIFAFVFPLSLIIVTIIASIRIADKLDEQYLEELAMNKSIMEENEEEDDEEEEEEEAGKERAMTTATPALEKIAPRARNRPKREV